MYFLYFFRPIKIVDDGNCRSKISSQHFSAVFTFETLQKIMVSRRKRVVLAIDKKYETLQMIKSSE